MTAEKNRKAIMRGITALLVLSAITLGCAISARSCVKTALGAADAVKALKKNRNARRVRRSKPEGLYRL